MNLHFQVPRARSLISLTPLIDVVFILLLFFMLASSFTRENGLAVRAAADAGAVADSDSPPGRLRVLDQQMVSFDGELLDRTTLMSTLAERLRRDPSLALSISVDSGARVQALLELIALADRIGFSRVSIESSLP